MPITHSPPNQGEVDLRRRALKLAMEGARMTAADVARAADLPNANSIYNFFGGRSKDLSAETYRRIARVIPGATVASLQGIAERPPP